MSERLLTALLAIILHAVPQPMRGRIDRNRAHIAQAATDGEDKFAVPPGVLLVVGFRETHLGTDNGEGGNWGAPISRFRRHVAGTPLHAARALAWGFRVCRTWEGAIGHYAAGLCHPWQAWHRRYVASTLRWVERVHLRAGVDLPANFRYPTTRGRR